MDLKQLRSFLVLATTLSFGRAARQLRLSQSALSTQIQNLETHLGVKLLERNRRTVRLTAAGQSVFADGERLLEMIAETELRAIRVGAGDVGHLRVAFVASATAELIPAIVLAFRKRFPRVSLELKNLPTAQQVDALKDGSIDIGFVRMPLESDGLSVESIHVEPFAIVLPKTHSLASRREVSVRDLAEESFIAYGRKWAPGFYEHWTSLCRKAAFSPNVVQEAAEMETALVLVAAGLGVAILPYGIVRRSRALVKIKPLLRERLRSEIGVAVFTSRSTPLHKRFLEVCHHVGRH